MSVPTMTVAEHSRSEAPAFSWIHLPQSCFCTCILAWTKLVPIRHVPFHRSGIKSHALRREPLPETHPRDTGKRSSHPRVSRSGSEDSEVVVNKNWVRAYMMPNSHYGKVMEERNLNAPGCWHQLSWNGGAPTPWQVNSQKGWYYTGVVLFSNGLKAILDPTALRLTYTPGPHGAVWNQKTNLDKLKASLPAKHKRRVISPAPTPQLLCTILALFWSAALSKNALGNWRQLVPF